MPKRPNTVRVIGGVHRGRLIRFPDVEGLRPTPDRVRETLFNWLGQDLHGKVCLDLFAGSGALGIEAASRGAREVLMVDRSRQVVAALRASVEALRLSGVRVECRDALEFVDDLRRRGARFDVVFLDPPFGGKGIPRVEPLLPDLLDEHGVAYVESEHLYRPSGGLRVLKQGHAGMVHYALAAKAGEQERRPISEEPSA